MHLNEEDVEMSWIVLSSKIMKTVHLLRLDSFPDEEPNEEKDVLGGMLYQSENEVKITNLGETTGSAFWDNIDVMFTSDSK